MKSVVRWMLRATFSPPRCTYKDENTLSVITVNSQIYYRTIFEFNSPKGEKIVSSLWRDKSEENPSKCLIYLHSLGANQFEAVNIIPAVCTKELSVVSFDFPGCGLSGGTILPLDGSGPQLIKTLVDYLNNNFHYTEYAIWGRSMGAAVALHTVSVYPDMFKCIIADSSFACTEKILKDQGRANGFPSFLIKMLMPIIKKEAKEDLKTNVDVPFPIEYIPNAKIPLLQGHGNKDRFVPCEHAKMIFDSYGGLDKQLNFFEGRHNSPRPNSWYETVCRFLYRHLNINEKIRCYDYVYHASKLHVGLVEQVLPDVLRVNEALRQREIQNNKRKSLLRKASVKLNREQDDHHADNENDQENNNEYDNQNLSGSDNEYDYDDDYDENQENSEYETGNNENDQIYQNSTTEKIQTPHSLLIPEENIHTKSSHLNISHHSDSQIPIEDSSITRIKVQQQNQDEIDEQQAREADVEKNYKMIEKKNKEEKKKRRKVWFDSLSEIGTDIDLGEKINDLNRIEEEKRRREMLKSVEGFHHHHHHRRHHHRIPLSSTKQNSKTSSYISNARSLVNINTDAKYCRVGEKDGKIKKAASVLMHELPLATISDTDN